jgi:hypothetical protein
MPVGRFVLVQFEGRNFLPISEVEVFQPAMSGVDVTVGAYMPSPSTLSDASQLSVSPSDACNDLKQCRSALTFTSGNWNVPQTVSVLALDDDVASGLRTAVIAHTTSSSDVDYRGSEFFNPKPTVTATIEDDDFAGITMSKDSIAVVEGAHTYLGAQKFAKLMEVPVLALTCSETPALVEDAKPCRKHGDRTFAGTWWDTSISLKPLASPTFVVADFGPGVTGDIVQLHMYKPQDLGSRGVAKITLTHSDVFTFASIPATWEPVEGTSSHKIPWGMTAGSINHTIQDFASNKRYIAVFFDQTYGGHAMGDGKEPALVTPLQVHEMTFTGAIPYAYPDERGNWNVSETNLSRMHLAAVPDQYTVVLDSEPLSDVVITPVVQDDTQLTSWDKFNGSFNQDYSQKVITGIYHLGNRYTEIATSLHFNASTWHIPQTVQIGAVDNNIAAGNRVLSVTHKSVAHMIDMQPVQQTAIGTTDAFSQDILPLRRQYQYQGISKYHTVTGNFPEWPRAYNMSYESDTGKIAVAIAEDDRPGVTVSKSHVYVTEGASNGTFTVVLDSQPTSAVTITLLVTGESGEPGKEVEVIVTPNVLVFNDQTWSVPQQVVLTAYNDADYEGRYGFTQAYSRYIPQPFAERIVLAVSSEDRTYSNILIGQNEPEGTRVQYVRDQSIEVTVIDDDGGCLSEYKCQVPPHKIDEYTPEGICVPMDSAWFEQNFDPETDEIPAVEPDTTSVCDCPQGYGMRDCRRECAKSSLCEFRRIHFIVECNEIGVCTKSAGLNKASFVTELARSILLYNARLMERLNWPVGASQTAFPGLSFPASPSELASEKIAADSMIADSANQPVTAPTRMPTPAPTPPTTAPTASPTVFTSEGSYAEGSYVYVDPPAPASAPGSAPASAPSSARRVLETVPENEGITAQSMPARRQLQEFETVQQQPLTMESVWDSFYVVKALPTQCMFSFKKICTVVTVDIKDETGELTEFLLQSERAGHYAQYPLNVQFAKQADTLDHNSKMAFIMWNVMGFIMLLFCGLMLYKVRKSFMAGKQPRTEAEKRAFRESQAVFD